MSLSNANNTPSWFIKQIDTILNKYYYKENQLKAIFWPKYIRNFLIEIIQLFLLHSDEDLKVAFPTRNIDQSILSELISTLSSPTMCYITPSKRAIIKYILLQCRYRINELHITPLKPPPMLSTTDTTNTNTTTTSEADLPTWPSDIMDIEDLQESISRQFLRQDIRAYILHIVKHIVGNNSPIMLTYNDLNHTDNNKPICITIQSYYYTPIVEYIDMISKQLSATCEGLLPADLITVIGDDNIVYYTKVRED